jgi:AcrR family transcriptional regulator
VAAVSADLRERRFVRTRAEIVAVALALFEKRGFDEVTAEEIARDAGVSPRTFFRYFDTKASLVLGGSTVLVDRLVEALETADQSAPLREALAWSLERAFDAIGADGRDLLRRESRIMLTSELLRAAASMHIPAQDARVMAALEPWIPADMDAAQRHMLGASIGIALWMSLQHDASAGRGQTARASASFVMKLLDAWPTAAPPDAAPPGTERVRRR